jgi:Na+/H+-dicarboxylate symporters
MDTMTDMSDTGAKTPWYRQLYFWVIVAIIAGVVVGWLAPGVGKAMEPIGTTFVQVLRMLIGPIVFLTIIGGIAGVADLRKVGLTGIKALVYFQIGTLLALGTGCSRSTSSRWATGCTPTSARSRCPTRSAG